VHPDECAGRAYRHVAGLTLVQATGEFFAFGAAVFENQRDDWRCDPHKRFIGS